MPVAISAELAEQLARLTSVDAEAANELCCLPSLPALITAAGINIETISFSVLGHADQDGRGL